MAIGIPVRPVRGALVGNGLAQAQHRAKRGDEQLLNCHKLAPEFEMQHASPQSQNSPASAGFEGGNSGKIKLKKDSGAQLLMDS
jgi:hypothetical protein